MSANLATIHVTGNVVDTPVKNQRNPELVTFRVASNHSYRKDSGEWVNGDPMFVTVQCWGRLGKNVLVTLAKGMPVIVVGRLYQAFWEGTDEQGNDKKFSALRIKAMHVGPNLLWSTADVQAGVGAKKLNHSGSAAPQEVASAGTEPSSLAVDASPGSSSTGEDLGATFVPSAGEEDAWVGDGEKGALVGAKAS